MKKDGKGNVIISEEKLKEISKLLLSFNPLRIEIENVLNQKYIFETIHNGLSLVKRFDKDHIEWSGEDIGLVYELFKDTKILYKKPENLLPLDGSEDIKSGDFELLGKDKHGWVYVKPEDRPWLIERPLIYDHICLTISENGINNRPWKSEEIEMIENVFNK